MPPFFEPPVLWRIDGRCGVDYLTENGSPTQCNPDGNTPCCSNVVGRCGGGDEYCTCNNCKDFRECE